MLSLASSFISILRLTLKLRSIYSELAYTGSLSQPREAKAVVEDLGK